MRDIFEWEFKRSCKFLMIRVQTHPLRCILVEVTIVKKLIPYDFCNDFGRVNKSRIYSNEIVVSNFTVLQGEGHKLVKKRLKVLGVHDIDQRSLVLKTIAKSKNLNVFVFQKLAILYR